MVSVESKVKRRRLMMPDKLGKSGESFPTSEYKVNMGENGESSHKVATQSRLTIRTACNPKQLWVCQIQRKPQLICGASNTFLVRVMRR
ncbi:uncharacterized protein LOC126789090 isoform X2 [Argentina anserina]|nr:uncharacterized protein LOC126789090 isoform X2 [Potentilla anserina]XP_050371110.1 uncharacterized protein LOC126789090 isoform X2 [Potentilla anserina]